MLKILVALDGSQLSQAALPVAAKLAAEAKASITLLTVVEPERGTQTPSSRMDFSPATGRGTEWPVVNRQRISQAQEPGWVESPEQADARSMAETTDTLLDAASYFKERGLEASEQVVEGSNPAQRIIETARSGGYDLIVMSSHGRSGLSALTHGSVAGEVLGSAVAPVLMVRPAAS